MISAFGVEHGEISKGWLKGAETSALRAFRAGRGIRGSKTSIKMMQKLDPSNPETAHMLSQLADAKKQYGVAGRLGYRTPEIAVGAASGATGGGGYAYGKKSKKSAGIKN